MGIRPSVHFVAAVQLEVDGQKITDPRWLAIADKWYDMSLFGPSTENLINNKAAPDDLDAFENEMYLFTAYRFNHRASDGETVGDYLTFESEGWSIPGLMGYKIDSLPYDNNCLWALAAIHPEYHSQSCFVELPKVPPDENCSEKAQWWKLAQEGVECPYPLMVESYQRKLDRGHNYSTFHEYAPGYIDAALWFFNEILGFKGIRRDEIRLGVMWLWQ